MGSVIFPVVPTCHVVHTLRPIVDSRQYVIGFHTKTAGILNIGFKCMPALRIR